MKFCTMGWCDNQLYAFGMCRPHYDRWRRTGERGGWIDSWTRANPRPLKTCTIEGCDRKHYAKGLCNMHYARVRYSGVAGGPEDKRRTHVVRHGTHNEYKNYGCRCESCKRAASEYQRALMASPCPGCGKSIYGRYDPKRLCRTCAASKRVIPLETVHGTPTGYSKGCRCRQCRDASAAARRQSRRKAAA